MCEMHEKEMHEQNEDIGYLLKILNEQIRKRADKELVAYDLTFAQMQVMWFVHSRGGETTQKEIEKFFRVSHPTVAGLISRMEKKGFLETRVNPEDRRGRLVGTTKKADQFRDVSIQNRKDTEKMLRAHLSDEELSELKRMLKIIYKNLKDEDK